MLLKKNKKVKKKSILSFQNFQQAANYSPLKTEFGGAIFGVINDKFGIRWMLNYDKTQNH